MRLEFRDFKASDWGFIKLHTSVLCVEDTLGIVAIDSETKAIVAAALADNFTGTSCQCHMIIVDPMALRHTFMEVCCDFIFNDKGMQSVYGWVPANNKKALKLNKHMGWTVKTVIEGGFTRGVDYVLMELTRNNCPYLEKAEAA